MRHSMHRTDGRSLDFDLDLTQSAVVEKERRTSHEFPRGSNAHLELYRSVFAGWNHQLIVLLQTEATILPSGISGGADESGGTRTLIAHAIVH